MKPATLFTSAQVLTGLERQTHIKACLVNLASEGRPKLGRRAVLFGALAMQQWGIRPIPDKETLDMSHYSEDFLEF
jgi:hypothetical protein